jgi:hypothetical protein
MNNLQVQLNQITENSLARLFSGNNRRVNNMPTPTGQPKFIIKYGPPASGKGSGAVRSVIESLGDPVSSYININVDDAVEATKAFRNRSRALVNRLTVKPNSPDFNAFLNRASTNEVAEFAKVYTSIRFSKNSKGLDIGAKMDNLLTQALKAHKNITFETTGGNGFPTWIANWLGTLLKGYKIVVIFPTVPFEETWRRYKLRPTQVYKNGGGFRFASTKSQVRKIYRDSYLFMSEALGTGKVNWIDEIYIVGHASPTPLVVYPKRTQGQRQGQSVRNMLGEYVSRVNNMRFYNNTRVNKNIVP